MTIEVRTLVAVPLLDRNLEPRKDGLVRHVVQSDDGMLHVLDARAGEGGDALHSFSISEATQLAEQVLAGHPRTLTDPAALTVMTAAFAALIAEKRP